MNILCARLCTQKSPMGFHGGKKATTKTGETTTCIRGALTTAQTDTENPWKSLLAHSAHITRARAHIARTYMCAHAHNARRYARGGGPLGFSWRI